MLLGGAVVERLGGQWGYLGVVVLTVSGHLLLFLRRSRDRLY